MRRAKRAWGFERLESRSLLTGTVNASLIQIPNDPVLFIAGDNANNHIVIHETRSFDGTINVKVDGIGTTIKASYQSLARPVTYKLPNYSGTSFVFRVKEIHINMGGGNDALEIYKTNLPGSLDINMGGGNDTLWMKNVHFAEPPNGTIVSQFSWLPTIRLGGGDDLAVVNNVSSTTDLNIDAGIGHDTVRMNGVAAGSIGSGNTITVDMGPGKADRLRVLDSTADHAVFNYSGKGGALIKAIPLHDPSGTLAWSTDSNHFGDEIESGFQKVGA